jgi:hypothetical protein
MRALLATIVTALLCGCASPGYHYQTGSFVQTPNTQPSQPSMARSGPPAICSKLTAEQCRDRIELDLECRRYSAYAYSIFGEKQAGLSEDVMMKNVSSIVYGPNGEAFRGSAETETLLYHVIAAAFYGNGLYGKTPEAFSEYAYQTCMRGDPF